MSFNDQKLNANLDVVIDLLGKPVPFSEIVGSKEAQRLRKRAQCRRTTHSVWRSPASTTVRN